MKTLIRKSMLFALIAVATVISSNAQRIIKGTVYREGKPAAGVTVEAHRSSETKLTGFDGKYEIKADPKSKYLRFTFIDDSRKLDIEGNTSDVIDFSFDGTLPVAGEAEEAGVNLKSLNELTSSNDVEFMNNFSIYDQFYKQGDYKAALPHWKVIYNKYPKSTSNIYIHGANMYESFLEKAKDRAEKSKYLDTLMSVYDRRIKYFDQKGFVLGRKGTTWLKYNLPPDESLTQDQLKEIYKKGYEWLETSLKEQGKESEIAAVVLLMQTTRALFQMGELPKETVVKNYDLCTAVLNEIEKNRPNEEDLADARAGVENIFGTSGAADCESLINIYTQQFDEKQNDLDFLKAMLRRLAKANCDDNPLFFKASEKMYQLEPSAEAAYNVARMYLKQENVAKAKEYYKQAMEHETDQSLLENYYYEYAYLLLGKDNNYPEARNYARKALAINPNNCRTLILMGDIYFSSYRTFSSDDFEKATVFWVAADYYLKAKNAGSDCLVDATKKANDCRPHFPNKETAFFNSIKEGDTYKVEGWINETTKVRF